MRETITLLDVGDVVLHRGQECVVVMVNDCRARIIPTATRVESFTNGRTGERVSFERHQGGENVSPNSELPVLRRGGPGLVLQLFGPQVFSPAAPGGSGATKTTGAKEREADMQTTKEKPAHKPRGGLAAVKAEVDAAAKAHKPRATKPEKVKKPKSEKKQSKCAFMDSLLIKGGLTFEQIITETLKHYPDAKRAPTLKTLSARPSFLKKAGLKPSWEKEEDKK